MVELKLTVQEALQNDVGRGIVRLDTASRRALDAMSGDIIKIKGKRETGAVVWQSYPQDEDQGIIRMDGVIRGNAGLSIGDHVAVQKISPKATGKIVLAPTQPVRFSPGFDSYVKKRIVGRPIAKGDKILVGVFGKALVMVAVSVQGRGIMQITEDTQVKLRTEPVKEIVGLPQVTYEDIGGVKDEVQKVREMIEIPLKHPELFERLGISPPKGVLLHGPPGTGKTLLAKAVANESDAHFIPILGPEIVSKFVGEAEERLRAIFKDAEENAPSIIFIDELDAIAPKRGEVVGEVEKRIVAQLLTLMDGLKSRGAVVVIGATNRVNALDPALRRPGRFDREIELGVPDRKGRKEILQIHTRNMPTSKDVDLDKLADITYGFVGADLEALAKEAAMKTLRRAIPKLELEEDVDIPTEVLSKLEVTKEDFTNALKEVQPSAMREVLVEVPNVRWHDIGGLHKVKRELREAVEWPLKKPEVFKRLGITPPRGIFLFGPPGTGKTLLAKAVANESDANFIAVKGPELLSKWVGESLPSDENVMVDEGQGAYLSPIGEVVKQANGNASVLCFDKNAKTKFSKVTDYLKHSKHNCVYKVKTKTGRSIRVTKDHSLFTLMDGKISSVPTQYLIPNESYIAIPSKMPFGRRLLTQLDILSSSRLSNIRVNNVLAYIKKAISRLGYKKVSSILNISIKTLYNVGCKNLSFDAKRFLKLMKGCGISFDAKKIRLSYKGSKHSYSATLKLDSNMCIILGAWVAEGDYMSHGVRISNQNPSLRKLVLKACKLHGLKCTVTPESIIINSSFFRYVMKEVLGMQGGARNKNVPKAIYNIGRKELSAFLMAYFTGDGSVYGNSHRFIIEASTQSKILANDLLYLLLRYNIVASCYEKTERNGNKCYRMLFSYVNNFKKFKEIGFADNKRDEKVDRYIKSKKWVRSNQIPIDAKMLPVLDKEWQNSSTIGRDKLKSMLAKRVASRRRHPELWKLVDSDIYWDKVTSVEKVKCDTEVYDLTVNPTQNFVGGFGGIFAHNSEKGVREIFRKARQAAPVIVFFDEIDSFAPRRGMHAGSHVTESVVNQLLSELDGIEALKDVVIIAATNRPDMVDPSLLRPGRFDRLIIVPAPDEKAREEILKVHTKGVPLDKDFKLKEIVSGTDGFSGADLGGIVREAAMNALRESDKAKIVKWKHFELALKNARPSIQKEDMKVYESFLTEHGDKDVSAYIG